MYLSGCHKFAFSEGSNILGKLQSCRVANNSVCSAAKCLKNLEAVRILLNPAVRLWEFGLTNSLKFDRFSLQVYRVFNRFSQRTVLTMLGLRASPEVHRTDSGRSKCNPTSPIFQWGIKQNAKSPLLNGLQVDHTNWSEMFGDSLFFVVCSWGWVSLWFMDFERILTWNVDGFRGYDWVFCFH